MEIQVGEYVRVMGRIAKLVKKEDKGNKKTYYFDRIVLDNFDVLSQYGIDQLVRKHSFNIIDLIEEGDYVNGYKVLDIDFKNEMICLLMPFDEENKSKYNIVWNTKYFIKSIVTKEIFQNIEYRVESN